MPAPPEQQEKEIYTDAHDDESSFIHSIKQELLVGLPQKGFTIHELVMREDESPEVWRASGLIPGVPVVVVEILPSAIEKAAGNRRSLHDTPFVNGVTLLVQPERQADFRLLWIPAWVGFSELDRQSERENRPISLSDYCVEMRKNGRSYSQSKIADAWARFGRQREAMDVFNQLMTKKVIQTPEMLEAMTLLAQKFSGKDYEAANGMANFVSAMLKRDTESIKESVDHLVAIEPLENRLTRSLNRVRQMEKETREEFEETSQWALGSPDAVSDGQAWIKTVAVIGSVGGVVVAGGSGMLGQQPVTVIAPTRETKPITSQTPDRFKEKYEQTHWPININPLKNAFVLSPRFSISDMIIRANIPIVADRVVNVIKDQVVEMLQQKRAVWIEQNTSQVLKDTKIQDSDGSWSYDSDTNVQKQAAALAAVLTKLTNIQWTAKEAFGAAWMTIKSTGVSKKDTMRRMAYTMVLMAIVVASCGPSTETIERDWVGQTVRNEKGEIFQIGNTKILVGEPTTGYLIGGRQATNNTYQFVQRNLVSVKTGKTSRESAMTMQVIDLSGKVIQELLLAGRTETSVVDGSKIQFMLVERDGTITPNMVILETIDGNSKAILHLEGVDDKGEPFSQQFILGPKYVTTDKPTPVPTESPRRIVDALIGQSFVTNTPAPPLKVNEKSEENSEAVSLEKAIETLGSRISIIDKNGNSNSSSLTKPSCSPGNNGKLEVVRFDGGRYFQSDSFALCKAQLSVNNVNVQINVMVEYNSGKLGTVWVVFVEPDPTGNAAMGGGYMVPLVDGLLNLNNPNLRRIEVIKDITGNYRIYLTAVNQGKTEILTYDQGRDSKDTPTPYIFGLVNTLLQRVKSGIDDMIPTPAAPPTPEPAFIAPELNGRSSEPNYETTIYSDERNYPPEVLTAIDQYKYQHPELNDKTPQEVALIRNPGHEVITILNFSNDTAFRTDVIAKIYNYLLSVAIKNQSFEYMNLRFEVGPPLFELDTTIGLIPSEIAENRVYTNWSPGAGTPHTIHIRLWPSGDMQNMPSIFKSNAEVSSSFVEVELCQATSRARVAQVPADSKNWSFISQEIYCNSHGLMILLRQKGFSYKQYTDFMTDKVTFPLMGDQYPPLIFPKLMYDLIPPLYGNPLAAQQ